MDNTTFYAFPWDGDNRIQLSVEMTTRGLVIRDATLPALKDMPVGDALYQWLEEHGYEPAIFQLEEEVNPYNLPEYLPSQNPQHYNRTGGVDSCEEYESFYRRDCPCQETQTKEGGE